MCEGEVFDEGWMGVINGERGGHCWVPGVIVVDGGFRQ